MPRIKTHKATARRFKVTGGGKLRRRKGHASYLRRKKSTRAKRELKGDLSVREADREHVRRIPSSKRALKEIFLSHRDTSRTQVMKDGRRDG